MKARYAALRDEVPPSWETLEPDRGLPGNGRCRQPFSGVCCESRRFPPAIIAHAVWLLSQGQALVLTAAALCVKPRGGMSVRQVVTVDALKAASPEFTAMRRLAMRFRGLLCGGTVDELDAWLIAARASGNLRNAAIRADDSPGHRGCSQRRVGAVEQRADRRTDQQAEDPQASHVRRATSICSALA